MSSANSLPLQKPKIILGSASAVIAIYLLTIVVTIDQSRNSLFATIFAKSFTGLLCLSFCYLLYSSGRLLRKVIGYISLVWVSLVILATLAGSIAWLCGSIPMSGILAGHSPVTVALRTVVNAYLYWVFIASKVVREFEKQPGRGREPVTADAAHRWRLDEEIITL